jgi:hypothetical protein
MSDHDPRVLKHIDALAAVGTDVQKFMVALDAIRTDRNLSSAAKTAILKTLAQEQAIGWVAAASGEKPAPITLEES